MGFKQRTTIKKYNIVITLKTIGRKIKQQYAYYGRVVAKGYPMIYHMTIFEKYTKVAPWNTN